MTSFAAELELWIKARGAVLYVVTAEEERALDLLEGAAQRTGRRLVAWSQTRGLGPPHGRAGDASLADPLRVLEHIATSDARAVYALLDLHPLLANPVVCRALRETGQALARTHGTLVLVSPVLTLPPELAKDVTVLDLPLPGPADLATALRGFVARAERALGARVALDDPATERLLRAARGLSLKEFAAALTRDAVARAVVDGDTVAAVHEAKRQVIRKSGVLEYVPAREKLDDVGGVEPLKAWLAARALAFTDEARRYGLPRPRGLLLVGVQGAGKSLCARCAAGQWSLALLRMDVGALFAGTVGASEANARAAMAMADALAPCVLWIDELDKAFAGAERSGASDGGTAARVFATLLTWLQERESGVFVIATANAVASLPPELLRKGRFDETFFVDLPSPAERREIARIHLAKRGRDPGAFDLEALAAASEGCSGAELEQAVIAGMFHAFSEARALESRDVLRALRESVPLARTLRESVESLRAWADGRARPANGAAQVAGLRVTV